MKFSKELLGTILHINIEDEVTNTNDFIFCVWIVESFENKYSRFIENNTLAKINSQKKAIIDSELYSLITLANKVSEISEWYYDISILPFLENSGYWISETKIEEKFWYKNIIVSEQKNDNNSNKWEKKYSLELKNNISIELGSLGKWYLIDKIYNYLSKKYTKFIIDFGWDIKVKWEYSIDLEDPQNAKKSIWKISLHNSSIAWSSWNKRVFNNTHHLISKHKSAIWENKKSLFVTHPLSIMSDSFATALYVSPLKICKKIIAHTPNLEAYIIMEDWEVLKSNWFDVSFS